MSKIQFDPELILTGLGKAQDFDSAIKFMEKACSKMRNFRQEAVDCFVGCGFRYIINEQEVIDNYKDNLLKASELQLSCSPEVIDQFNFPDTNNSILVTLVTGCAHRDLISCASESATKTNIYSYSKIIPEKAFEKFSKDIVKLGNMGLYHQAAMSDFSHWFLTPTKDRIIIDCWDTLRNITKRESERLGITLQSLFDTCNEQEPLKQAV